MSVLKKLKRYVMDNRVTLENAPDGWYIRYTQKHEDRYNIKLSILAWDLGGPVSKRVEQRTETDEGLHWRVKISPKWLTDERATALRTLLKEKEEHDQLQQNR
jgi:hypothetical protein